MLTLIGSTAAKHHFLDFREPNDRDYQSDKPIRRWEIAMADNDRADIFVDERLSEWPWRGVATPEELYTMKVSHAFWEINGPGQWNKHMADVVFFQRHNVAFIRELYDILRPIWADRYRRNPTNLNQSAGSFFADAVKRKYDHDSVHASIAYNDHPLYEDILKPGEEVAVDSSKFWAMDFDTQCQLVREEVYATALERILIPNEYKGSPMAAYAWALRRTITSLFKGDWALWTVLNYDTLSKPDCDYRARHLANVDKLILLENND